MSMEGICGRAITDAEVIRLSAYRIALGAVPGCVTCHLLLLTPACSEESLVERRNHSITLELSITGGVRREVHIGLILDKWVVPPTSTNIRQGRKDSGVTAYLLIIRAVTSIFSPWIRPLSMLVFCSSKTVTNSGP